MELTAFKRNGWLLSAFWLLSALKLEGMEEIWSK